ncbi:MAG: hypothetical protein AAFR41_13190 [Pseudomonadota bacterium]
MRRVHPNNAYRNDMDLPLFTWALRQAASPAATPAPMACWRVRAIARQTGFSLSRARLAGELAGLDLEGPS